MKVNKTEKKPIEMTELEYLEYVRLVDPMKAFHALVDAMIEAEKLSWGFSIRTREALEEAKRVLGK